MAALNARQMGARAPRVHRPARQDIRRLVTRHTELLLCQVFLKTMQRQPVELNAAENIAKHVISSIEESNNHLYTAEESIAFHRKRILEIIIARLDGDIAYSFCNVLLAYHKKQIDMNPFFSYETEMSYHENCIANITSKLVNGNITRNTYKALLQYHLNSIKECKARCKDDQ